MTGDGGIVHIGCYTGESGGRGEGVIAALRDPTTGALALIGTVARTPSPSFLAWHPALPVLYAVNEVAVGTISAWSVDDAATLVPLGTRPTGGGSPCHLAVTPSGGHLVTANYDGGSIAVHPLDPAGAPGERSDLLAHAGRGADPQRQERPHPHMVSPDPRGDSLLAVDLGTDSIYRYDLHPSTGRLLPGGPRLHTRPGTGPRHLARHPDGRRIYVVGELDATLTTYERDAGVLHERGRLPASAREGHVQPSEVAVRPDGRFLYVANRGVDTLAVFALDNGPPRYVTEIDTGGNWPRHFAQIDSHLYIAHERSHSIGVFVVDPVTGVPAPVDAPVDVPSPTCVLSDRGR
jgi:6-phosphogluconolactonase